MTSNTSQDFSVQNLDYSGHISRTTGLSGVTRYVDYYLGTKGSDPEGIYILVGDFTQNQKMAGHIYGVDEFSGGARGNFMVRFQSTIETNEPYRSINATVEYDRSGPSDIELVQVDYSGNTYGAIKIAGSPLKWYPQQFFFTGAVVAGGGALQTPILASNSEVSNETDWINTNTQTRTVQLQENVEFKGTSDTPVNVNIEGDLNVQGTLKGRVKILQYTPPFTLQLSDANTLIRITGDGDITVPTQSSVDFPVGTTIAFNANAGVSAGGANIVPDTGVNIQAYSNLTSLAGDYASAALVKIGNDQWRLSGNLV